MEALAQKLRKAYTLIAEASTTDIDAYMLAVEEAHGYIAEALDMVDSRDRFFTDDGSTAFFIDDRQVSCVEFNDYFEANDVGWQEDTRTWDGKQYTVLTIFTDDRG